MSKVYFKVLISDLTQEILDKSTVKNPYKTQRTNDGEHLLLSFEDNKVPLELLKRGYNPIDSSQIKTELSKPEWDNFQESALVDKSPPKDSDSAPLSRIKIAPSGWHYQLMSFEVETAKKDSLYCKDSEGTDLGYASVKFYNDDDEDISGQLQAVLDTSCTKTVVDFEAPFDIEIFGGILNHEGLPASDVRVWVIAAPDIPAELGGKIHFFNGGLNLKYITSAESIKTDGKVPKRIKYDPVYHSGVFRLVIKHGTGFKHAIQLGFEYYKL